MTPTKRAQIVEAAAVAEGWSLALAERLAKRCGCSVPTIRRDWAKLQAAVEACDDAESDQRSARAYRWRPAREERRVARLEQLRQDMEAARKARAWSGVFRGHGLSQKLEGLDTPPPEPAQKLGLDVDDPRTLLGLLETMLRDAMARGNDTAAQKLVGQLQDLAAKVKHEERLQAERDGAAAGDSDLISQIRAFASEYEPPVLDRLISTLQEIRGQSAQRTVN